MDLFGAKTIDEVPKSVRDKMKLSDYDGKGHPLSAHRIRSVAKAAKIALTAQTFSVSGNSDVVDVFAGVDDEMAKQAAEEGALNPLFGGPDLIGN